MTVVIVGGAGFVGLNIAEALLTRGTDVTLFDATPPPDPACAAFAALPGRLVVVTGDVTVPDTLAPAFKGAEALIYGAAITAAPERDAAEPERILDVNLMGLVNALRAGRDAGVRRTINLSSAGAYGPAGLAHDVLTEDTPADPVSLYAVTKFASERVTARMADAWRIDALSVRLSAVFGRWERRTSVRDTPSPPFQVMEAALAGRPVRLPRRDHRDYVYAGDVAQAVLGLLDAPRLAHRLYNISAGTRWALVDWAQALGRHLPLDCALADPGEETTIDFHTPADRGMLDIGRLAADTGFVPRYGLEASAADYAAWIARRGNPPG